MLPLIQNQPLEVILHFFAWKEGHLPASPTSTRCLAIGYIHTWGRRQHSRQYLQSAQPATCAWQAKCQRHKLGKYLRQVVLSLQSVELHQARVPLWNRKQDHLPPLSRAHSRHNSERCLRSIYQKRHKAHPVAREEQLPSPGARESVRFQMLVESWFRRNSINSSARNKHPMRHAAKFRVKNPLKPITDTIY